MFRTISHPKVSLETESTKTFIKRGGVAVTGAPYMVDVFNTTAGSHGGSIEEAYDQVIVANTNGLGSFAPVVVAKAATANNAAGQFACGDGVVTIARVANGIAVGGLLTVANGAEVFSAGTIGTHRIYGRALEANTSGDVALKKIVLFSTPLS